MVPPPSSVDPWPQRWLARCQLYLRWWVSSGWNSVHVWRRIVVAVVVLALVLTVVRRPLADWLWPESRIEQLLGEGRAALAAGRLSADDGSGALELLQAAQALDSDRADVRAALVQVGQEALQRADGLLARGQYDAVPALLALARRLQLPAAEIAQRQARLQQGRAGGPQLEALLEQARAAHADGRIDGDGGALPLLRQALVLRPDYLPALELREDLLTDLLAQARADAARGQLVAAAQTVSQAAGHDPGHVDLPDTRARLSLAIEQRRAQAQRALARGQLEAAGGGFAVVLEVAPDDADARAGRHAVASAWAERAQRRAAEFDFAGAQDALARAQALEPGLPQAQAAAAALQAARRARGAMQSPLGGKARTQRLAQLLVQIEAAEARGQWLVPPGNSVYDLLMAAQALAPADARLAAVHQRLLAAVRDCLESQLRANRVRGARGCHDAWQALAPNDAGLVQARARLAQRWLAVGDERLGRGDVRFAQEALAQARELGAEPAALAAFAARVQGVGPPR